MSRKKKWQSQKIEFTAQSLEIKAADDESAPPSFDMVAYNGGELRLGNFAHPVVVATDGVEIHGGADTLPILRDHDTKRPVGHGTPEINAESLNVKGTISQVTQDAADVVAAAKNGFQWQASIGAALTEPPEFIKAGKSVNVNGRRFSGPVYVLGGTRWSETSIVSVGADQDRASTSIAATHSKEFEMKQELKDYIVQAGFDPDELEQSQVDFFEAQLAAKAPEQKSPSKQKLADVIAKETERQEREAKITSLTADAIANNPGSVETIKALAEVAIEAAWDVDKFELELLRGCRSAPSRSFLAAGNHKKQSLSEDVLEAAFCRTAGLEDAEDKFKERTLEAADQCYKEGLGVKQLIFIAAQANGYRNVAHNGQITREVLEYAFAEQSHIRATSGFSTVSLPNILSNVANKFVREGFLSVDQAWRQIAATRSVTDFKQVTTNTLVGDFDFSPLAAGGEIEHSVPSEVTYSNQVSTFARLLGLSRRDLTNDDTSALSSAGRRLGRGGALKLNDVFWSTYLNNATFFSADNNNVLTGAGSALTLDGESINAAEDVFWAQTDPDGKPLGTSPAILLVPTVLHNTALRLMNSSGMVGGTDPTVGDSNVYQGRYQVVTSPYLSNASYTGSSSTAWYLLAAPGDLPVVEMAFLNGRDTPTVETAQADFNQLGIQMRGYSDMGCALQEFRGGVRAAGA